MNGFPLRQEGRPPLVFGHRGYSRHGPENTLASFRLLLERDIPGVEFDVRQTIDGRIVVSHDDSLKRLAGVDCSIASSTLEEVRSHDVGAWFGDEFRGETVPLLEEVLDLLGDRVYYDIEVKPYRSTGVTSGTASTELRVIELVTRAGLAGRTMLSSFDPRIIARCRSIDPRIPGAVIYADVPEMPWFLRRGQGRLLSGASVMKPEKSQATAGLVDRNHKRGRAVVPWTVDTREDAERLDLLGVDGLVSNCPGEILM